MTARRRHDDGTTISSFSTSVVGLPAHRQPLPTLSSTVVPSRRLAKPRTPSTGVDLHRVDESDRGHARAIWPSLTIFPASRAFNLWLPQQICPRVSTGAAITTGGGVRGASRPKSVKNRSIFGHVLLSMSSRGIASLGCNLGGVWDSSGGEGRGGGGGG